MLLLLLLLLSSSSPPPPSSSIHHPLHELFYFHLIFKSVLPVPTSFNFSFLFFQLPLSFFFCLTIYFCFSNSFSLPLHIFLFFHSLLSFSFLCLHSPSFFLFFIPFLLHYNLPVFFSQFSFNANSAIDYLQISVFSSHSYKVSKVLPKMVL
ncbi:unnamed protein product [Acanthosepion pharaonis]|uniref:Uncharacterized protein n=1 Tax=Acanthosepion pharaonis TaxID=158019 RepID=A0A812CS20_ACAPH|nr:unnamed protein product [Sepia pharaonis]